MKKARKEVRRRPAEGAKAKADEIVASLREAIEVERSGVPLHTRFTVRTVAVPDPPAEYDPKRVLATREKLGVSQSVFAHLLGVSAILVQSWERGVRTPAVWARRLLDEVNRDPAHWLAMLRRSA